ncbi:MAG: FAA hydrolase family protein [Leptolyngbya sp. DLM2.Bin27]|nr:MAG: FAA hydrolase family protein [Leptolyngbya sp. DLM2.Bin27]
MAQRYVRVQSQTGQLHYGLLRPDRSVQVLDAPPWLQGQPTDMELSADSYAMLAPCAPSKVVAIGKNYAARAIEMGTTTPAEPLLFIKPSTAVIAAGAPIYYPTQATQIDYEGELAVVIGTRCAHVPPDEAHAKIWGYTIANDITARDLQQRDDQWTRAKGFDTFCPLGPWIVRELSPGARLQTFLNQRAEPVQSASVEDMTYSPDYLVAYISEIMTLLPGDVILTGTPAGSGPMKVGDQVRVEIEGIGGLSNTVALRPQER